MPRTIRVIATVLALQLALSGAAPAVEGQPAAPDDQGLELMQRWIACVGSRAVLVVTPGAMLPLALVCADVFRGAE
jgi:hypothetical protein